MNWVHLFSFKIFRRLMLRPSDLKCDMVLLPPRLLCSNSLKCRKDEWQISPLGRVHAQNTVQHTGHPKRPYSEMVGSWAVIVLPTSLCEMTCEHFPSPFMSVKSATADRPGHAQPGSTRKRSASNSSKGFLSILPARVQASLSSATVRLYIMMRLF